MSHNHRYAHTYPVFKDPHLLKLTDIISLQTNIFIHKSLLTYQLNSGFQSMSNNSNSRRSNDLKILYVERPMHGKVLHLGSKIVESAARRP